MKIYKETSASSFFLKILLKVRKSQPRSSDKVYSFRKRGNVGQDAHDLLGLYKATFAKSRLKSCQPRVDFANALFRPPR